MHLPKLPHTEPNVGRWSQNGAWLASCTQLCKTTPHFSTLYFISPPHTKPHHPALHYTTPTPHHPAPLHTTPACPTLGVPHYRCVSFMASESGKTPLYHPVIHGLLYLGNTSQMPDIFFPPTYVNGTVFYFILSRSLN